MNTLTRDQIIHKALNDLDSPTLDQKERPDGVNITGTLLVDWLEQGLKQAYNLHPMAATLASSAVTLTAGSESIALPARFIKDFPDGLVLVDGTDERRLKRRTMEQILEFKTVESARGRPIIYVALPGGIRVRPIPEKAYTGTLHFYQMPTMPGQSDVPAFPDDMILVKYLFLSGKEWVHQVEPGTALGYLRTQVAALRSAGLSNEAENDQIPVDRHYFPGGGPADATGPFDWMGSPIGQGGYGQGGYGE